MRAHSLDLRHRIISALERGQSVADVGARFAVSGGAARASPARHPLIGPARIIHG
jgi:hypothetical protein